MGWPLRPRPGARLRPEHARQKLRLWGHPVRMSCKNFLTTHQLDTHFWTEFLYTFSWQYDLAACVQKTGVTGQRAVTSPRSARANLSSDRGQNMSQLFPVPGKREKGKRSAQNYNEIKRRLGNRMDTGNT